MLDILSAKAVALANVSNAEVVLRLLDYIDKTDSPCSYARYLGGYVNQKLILNSLNKDLDNGYSLSFSAETHRRILSARDKMIEHHKHMYDNVCMSCPACMSRKKNWPRGLVKDH